MRYPICEVFNIAKLNPPIASTVIQEQITEGVHVYSLGAGTSMSPESFRFYKMLFVKQGKIRITLKREDALPVVQELKANDGMITPKNAVILVDAIEDSVYLEVLLGQVVNHTIKKPGEVFSTPDVGKFVQGQIHSTEIITSGFVEVNIMCIDSCSTKRRNHTNTMIFGYEGDGEVDVDGKKFLFGPGCSMRFTPEMNVTITPLHGRMKVGVTNFFI